MLTGTRPSARCYACREGLVPIVIRPALIAARKDTGLAGLPGPTRLARSPRAVCSPASPAQAAYLIHCCVQVPLQCHSSTGAPSANEL
jgi:hypothetical protein